MFKITLKLFSLTITFVVILVAPAYLLAVSFGLIEHTTPFEGEIANVAYVSATVVSVLISILPAKVVIDILRNRKSENSIEIAPGATINVILKFLIPQKAYEGIFVQTIADMRDEYFTALAANETKKAKWIKIRGQAHIAIVFIQYLFVAFVDRGVNIYKLFGSGN